MATVKSATAADSGREALDVSVVIDLKLEPLRAVAAQESLLGKAGAFPSTSTKTPKLELEPHHALDHARALPPQACEWRRSDRTARQGSGAVSGSPATA